MNPAPSRLQPPISPTALLPLLLLSLPVTAQNFDPEQTAWEFPLVTQVRGAHDLVAELQFQVQRVLDAGTLAPRYISYSDQESVGYTVYQEPGRIITSLAWAYPHLTPQQQTDVRSYVQSELANPATSPWGRTAYGRNHNSNFPLPRDHGSPREDHPRERWWHARNDFGLARPFLHTLYGVWLYGFRTGDWHTISNHWSDIRQLYANYGSEDAYKLYGTLGTHIAVCRLARQFNDATTQTDALQRLSNLLQQGLNFDTIESYARGAPGLEWRSPYGSYPDMYDSRMTSSTYRGWIFLNLTPEIGRYLHSASPPLRTSVLTRHNEGLSRFRYWWIPKASYFNRSWTGDEGSGLVPEVLGRLAPVERWVAQSDARTLRNQMRSAPNGRGDCYWLEALTQTIDAHGRLLWIDVRQPPPVLDPPQPTSTGGVRLSLQGAASQTYTLQASTNLTEWLDLASSTPPLPPTNTPPPLPPRFFRAR